MRYAVDPRQEPLIDTAEYLFSAPALKRFLTQLKRHHRPMYDAIPEEFRSRYAPSPSRLLADMKGGQKQQSACAGCEFYSKCPVEKTGRGYVLHHTAKQRRLAARRAEQATEAWTRLAPAPAHRTSLGRFF